ncbi:MAG: hypothetical protein WBB47_15455 [Paenisporosarcina sp.]
MKYQQRDFTPDLKARVNGAELELKDYIERLLYEYKSVFAEKNLEMDVGLDKEGIDPFIPGYSSSVSIGIIDESGELDNLYIIKIWECGRSFLGMPISFKIPGSKIIGELLDEELEEVKIGLKEDLEDLLVDET